MNIFSSMPGKDHRLIISIVKRGVAQKVVTATKEAKIGGGTVLLGKGTAPKKIYLDLLGMDYNPEKDIILTLVEQEKLASTLNLIAKVTDLDKPGKGIAFIIRAKEIIGHIHMENSQKADGGLDMSVKVKECPLTLDLIVTVVNDGFAEDAIEAAKKAGAEGGTIIHGRGSGIHENAKLFGISIQPEKEIILTLVDTNKTQQILGAINNAVKLDQPHTGIAFVLPVEKAYGICHLS